MRDPAMTHEADPVTDKIGIVAGGGAVPGQLIASLQDRGQAFFVIGLDGHVQAETLDGTPHLRVRIGAVGTALDALRREGVRRLIFAGSVRRPSLAELRPDWTATRLIARMGPKIFTAGDDALLSAVVKVLEGEGFTVERADALLDGLLAEAGYLGRHRADAGAEADIARGVAILHALGPLDVGQAVVVQQGLCLGIEAIEGTDALLARVAPLRREGGGGVLVKLRKPGQSERVDLPTIGAATVSAAAQAGLAGIAVDAGGAWIVDRAAVIETADRLGLFLKGIAGDMP